MVKLALVVLCYRSNNLTWTETLTTSFWPWTWNWRRVDPGWEVPRACPCCAVLLGARIGASWFSGNWKETILPLPRWPWRPWFWRLAKLKLVCLWVFWVLGFVRGAPFSWPEFESELGLRSRRFELPPCRRMWRGWSEDARPEEDLVDWPWAVWFDISSLKCSVLFRWCPRVRNDWLFSFAPWTWKWVRLRPREGSWRLEDWRFELSLWTGTYE